MALLKITSVIYESYLNEEPFQKKCCHFPDSGSNVSDEKSHLRPQFL